MSKKTKKQLEALINRRELLEIEESSPFVVHLGYEIKGNVNSSSLILKR